MINRIGEGRKEDCKKYPPMSGLQEVETPFTETGNSGRGLGVWKQGEETRIRLCGDPLKESLRI